VAQSDSKLRAAFLSGSRFLRKPQQVDEVRHMAKRWYSVSVLSNFEKKIAEQIRTSVEEKGLEDQIDEVLVPTEEVIEVRRGKKVTTERRFMPGYVLVHMEMSDEGYHLINSINRVTGFLGPQGRPMPMRDAEVNGILNRVQEGEEAPKLMISFDVGEKVKVNDGPFEDFDGMVEEVDEDNQKLKVTVSIFGRETPVELDYTQVTKQV
jgi:transcriptional antiterminator NusG